MNKQQSLCPTDTSALAASPSKQSDIGPAMEIDIPLEKLREKLPSLLIEWFAQNRRPLPWRADYSPYRTWIAEVMMQQTQMDRGVEYFNRWMRTFPDIASVAQASEEELLKAWEGLGYYRRARNIQAAAREIMAQHGGEFPSEYATILELPGIGPYTAGAIASTAFNISVPCVDGNVERVLSRVCNIDSPVREEPARSLIRDVAEALIPPGQARELNQAMMELGALVCRKRPECVRCPIQQWCESRRLGLAESRPVPGRKPQLIKMDVVCGILVHQGKIFIQRREDTDVWGGLWEFPGGCVESGETSEDAIVREWGEETGFQVAIDGLVERFPYSYTKYRMTMRCYRLHFACVAAESIPPEPTLTAASTFRWILPEEIDAYPLPSPHRKIADRYPLFGRRKDVNQPE